VKTARPTIREQLETRLNMLGWIIAPGHALNSAVGYYRVNQKFDDTIVTWETWAYRKDDRFKNPKHLVSYNTMSACVKGCTIRPDDARSKTESLYWVDAVA
jgi:hypothetical protein